jgi:hypothetical protein
VISWFGALGALTLMETRRFVRTPGVVRYLLVPAWLVMPAALVAYVALMTYGAFEIRVAIPASAPPELGLAEHIAGVKLVPFPVADPAAAFEGGEVQAAVLSIDEGDGIYGSRAFEANNTAYRYKLTAVALDNRVRKALERGLRAADAAALEALVSASGGVPAEDLWVGVVELALEGDDREGATDSFRASYLAAYLLWLLGLIGYLLLVSGPVADRAAGVVESLLVAPVHPTAYVLARVLAVTGIQAAAASLLFGSAYLLASGWVDIVPSGGQVAALAAGAVLLNTVYFAVGSVSSSMKVASNAAGTMWLLTTLGFVLTVALDLPSFIPLIGLVAAQTPAQWWLSAVASIAATLLLVWLVGRVLDHFPHLKIGGDG